MDERFFMCDLNGKIAKLSSQFEEATDLFLYFWGAKTEAEDGQGNFEQNLGPFQEEHIPHSQHCTEW